MNKRQLIAFWVMACLLFFCIYTTSNVYCESSKVIYPENIASTTLKLFYDSGAINGYVIFRNSEGEMCAVQFIETALLRNINYSYKKNLGLIDVKDFKLLELKNRDVILAYEIKPFIFDLRKDEKVTIFFEWGRITASCEVSNLLGN